MKDKALVDRLRADLVTDAQPAMNEFKAMIARVATNPPAMGVLIETITHNLQALDLNPSEVVVMLRAFCDLLETLNVNMSKRGLHMDARYKDNGELQGFIN